MRRENDSFFEDLFVLYLILEPINQALRLLIGYWTQFIFPVIYLVLILIHIKKIKNLKIFLLFIAFFAMSACYSFFGYREYIYNFLGLMYLLFVVSLPWLLVGLNTRNTKLLFDKINKKLIYIMVANLVLIFTCMKVKGALVGNMEISYSILPLAVFSLYDFLESKKFFSLLLFFIALFVIIGFGSRGPLLCVLAFFVIYLFLNFKRHKYLFSFLAILSTFLVFNFEPILYNSIDFLASHNIESRTLYKIKNGDITNDTGRNKIHDVVYDLMDDNWLMGVGVGVERIAVNEKIYMMEKDMSSCYPHNFFLEIIVQYGWLIGGVICVGVVFLLLRAVLAARGRERYLLLILISIEFVRLMVSSSYIVSVLLFYLIGLCIRVLKEKRTKYEKSLGDSAL